MGTDKNIKLHIVTDIKMKIKIKQSRSVEDDGNDESRFYHLAVGKTWD